MYIIIRELFPFYYLPTPVPLVTCVRSSTLWTALEFTRLVLILREQY